MGDRGMSAEIDRARLAKLLGVLGSDHDGEIAAAGRAADRLVRQAGLRWPEVILPALAPPVGDDTIANQIDFILGFSDALSDWERRFIYSIARRRGPLSEKQVAA